MDDFRPMRRAAAFAIFFIFAIGTAARADEVTTWNEVLFRSGIVAGTSSLNMTRFVALVQVAVFDAVNGIEGRYTPIHVAPAGPARASTSAAAMQAAYSILRRLYGQGGLFTPSQQPTLDADLAHRWRALPATTPMRQSRAAARGDKLWQMRSGHGGPLMASVSIRRHGWASQHSVNGGRLQATPILRRPCCQKATGIHSSSQ